MTESRLCVVCAVRGRQPQHYEYAQACEPCRVWLAETLTDVCALSVDVAAYLQPRQGGGQRVSGSREAPLPFVVDVVDLTGPSRPGSIAVKHRVEYLAGDAVIDWAARGGDPDQVGHLAVATELEFWVTDWIAMRGEAEHLPLPLVPPLAGWLTDRLTWAVDTHPAVDEFATAIYRLRGALSTYVPPMVDEDDTPRRPPEARTAPCPGCDMVSLWWHPGDDRVRCDNIITCGRVLTEDDYATWAKLVIEGTRRAARLERGGLTQ